MADAMLNQLANSGQSSSQITHTLHFTREQWCLFWRLLVVGCVLSDQLLEAAEQFPVIKTHSAKLWNELAS